MAAPPADKSRSQAWLALAVGALLYCGYFAWLLAQPRGLFEFGYAPFTPAPLPYSPMRGFTYEQLWGHVARFVLMTPAIALVGWAAYARFPAAFGALATRLMQSSRRALWIAAGACLSLTAVVMFGILRGRAVMDDELVYRMQATFLGSGHLVGPDIGVTPPDLFSVETRIGYTGKYLPGEGLVQIPGLFLGIPALMHLPLLALTLFAFHRAIALRAAERIANFATLLLALSPMLMLTSATGLTQGTSLCAVALTGLAYEWSRGPRPGVGGIVAGLAMTLGLATRPQAMLPAGLVFGPLILFALVKRKSWLALAGYAVTLGTGSALIGAYNHALTGSPLTVPWYLQCGVEHFGFGRVWTAGEFFHTPLTALENLAVVAVRWNAWWLGFPCSLAVLALWWRFGRPLFATGVWLWLGAALLGFEFLYYSPGASDTGAIYHYELLLPCSLLAGTTLNAALTRFPALTAALLATHVALGSTSWFGEQTLRIARLMKAVHEDSDALLARVTAPAVLFYETRGSEMRMTGWVHDGFPKRFRGLDDPIVTFPLLQTELRAQVQRAYPGRSCWYYRRNPESERAELYRCEDATALMNRTGTDEVSSIWIRPTAYRLTTYDPAEAARRQLRPGPTGGRTVLCCSVRYARKLRELVPPEAHARCVEDGHY